MCLITRMDRSSSSNGQNPGNADKLGVSGVVLCHLALIYLMNTGLGTGVMIPAMFYMARPHSKARTMYFSVGKSI